MGGTLEAGRRRLWTCVTFAVVCAEARHRRRKPLATTRDTPGNSPVACHEQLIRRDISEENYAITNSKAPTEGFHEEIFINADSIVRYSSINRTK